MIKSFLLLIAVITTSCSSTSFKDLFSNDENVEGRNQELMKDFEVEKDVLEKFQVKETPIDPITPVEKVESKKEETPHKAEKPVKLQPTPKKAHKKRAVITPAKPKNIKPKKTAQKYPEDFPEKLEAYDKESNKFWHQYKPYIFPGEKTVLNVTYMGISTGTIAVSTLENTKVGNKDVFHIQARLKTSDYYSYLYEVDDLCDSYLSQDQFLPQKFSLIQRQSSQDIDDLQLFDTDTLKTYSFYKRVTDDKTKKSKKEKFIPRLYQDPFSSLYFLRGLPMVVGNQYNIPIVNQGKVELLSAKIDGKETLNTEIGKLEAYRVNVNTKHSGKTIKGGNMQFWFSADERRVFLKFDAKIKIGKIEGEITSYKN